MDVRSPLTPEQRVLDLVHLARQTFGDRELERELLGLFEQQCLRLLPVMGGEERPARERSDAAHTLKGAARAVGAWRIAVVADALEAALDGGSQGAALGTLIADLERAVRETRAAAAQCWQAA